jgi:hypothetical protein
MHSQQPTLTDSRASTFDIDLTHPGLKVGTRLVWNRVPEFAEISQTAMPTVMHPESMMALHKRIPQWVNRYRATTD